MRADEQADRPGSIATGEEPGDRLGSMIPLEMVEPVPRHVLVAVGHFAECGGLVPELAEYLRERGDVIPLERMVGLRAVARA